MSLHYTAIFAFRGTIVLPVAAGEGRVGDNHHRWLFSYEGYRIGEVMNAMEVPGVHTRIRSPGRCSGI